MSGNEQEDEHRNARHDDVLARMLVATVNERETEQARISGVLHDQVSQVLSAVGLQLGIMRLDFQERIPEIEQRTTEIQQLLETVIDQLRELSYELNPSIVERAGLQTALDRLAGRVRREFGGSFRLHYESGLRIPQQVAAAFYKIAERATEEALNGKCQEIDVQVKTVQGEFVLEIRQDCEFQHLTDTGHSLTAMMMEHYAQQYGLQLEIKPLRTGATLVRASYPAGATQI